MADIDIDQMTETELEEFFKNTFVGYSYDDMRRVILALQKIFLGDMDKVRQFLDSASGSISNSEQIVKAAQEYAKEANDKADYTQKQLDLVVGETVDGPAVEQLKLGSDGTTTYDSPDQRVRTEVNALSTSLVQNTVRLDQKQAYEGSLVELLKQQSVLKNEVIVKVVSATQIDVGVFHHANKATIYTFKPDGDGWWRLFDAVVRPINKIEVIENYKKGVNFVSKTGVWNESEPTFYTTEVGATFSGEFTGTGLSFNSRKDNRGGIWEFVVDGYIKVQVSTYSATLADNVQTLIAKGLPNGKHSYVATFNGADPNNAPSGGTARGWANFYSGTGTTLRTIIPYIESYIHENGISVLQVTSRKEFAFSVRPMGSTTSARWIPEHGNLGAMKDIVTRILFDNVEVTDLSQETSNNYRVYRDVKFITSYTGYYTETDVPVWNARIDQVVNGEGYHNRHKMNFTADTEIVLGYPVMMAVSKTNTSNDYIVTSLGERYYLDPNLNDGTDIVINGDPVSVAHFVDQSGYQVLKDIVISFEVFDYKRTMRVGDDGRPAVPSRVEMRTDGERKTYFAAFERKNVRMGEKYDFGFSYFIGEIFNSSEILP